MNDLPGLASLLADPFVADILAGRRDGLLLLDYDGTLAPFTAKREEARPYPGVVEVLARLPQRGTGRFAVVSGRPAAAIPPFLYPARPAAVWGCHGAETLADGRTVRVAELPPRGRQALERAEALARLVAAPEMLERKPVSLALHWRGLGETVRRTLRREVEPAWQRLAGETGLTLLPFDGGLELRPAGVDKSLALKALGRDNPGTSLVYCGDDLTDEDVFRALGPTDVGVLVRREPRASAAGYRISPPEDLLRFLAAWAQAHTDPGPTKEGP